MHWPKITVYCHFHIIGKSPHSFAQPKVTHYERPQYQHQADKDDGDHPHPRPSHLCAAPSGSTWHEGIPGITTLCCPGSVTLFPTSMSLASKKPWLVSRA